MAIRVKRMNQSKNTLLWSSILLSLLSATNIVYSDDQQNPIYDPVNPEQQIQPLENTREESITTDSVPTTTDSSEEEKTVVTSKLPPTKKQSKKIYLTEELFDWNKILIQQRSIGSGNSDSKDFYDQLIDELVGTAIYGRKS
ncbi:hypothetical protein IV487_13585 [Enterococcus saccharolyticus]|uniref:Uncharacterized protein n=1 Tax=Candidatus Enterococcus willemsii TaxID=1857215 RepID=A0ABQ6YYP3_9ENTE|nr:MULTISPECIES: hypothetical protein [Enterococcus]KAF1303150.1 hypothetical protein BAU17_13650 [Enterococcus sp. CU12B]MCD5003497.1 hypothetical protein [Enterococcus saccharolyticus]